VQVAAHKASTVIVLHPDGNSSEAIKVSVAMSLTALGATDKQRVVVQGTTALTALGATDKQRVVVQGAPAELGCSGMAATYQ
jgi:hypothetical protein